MAFQSTHWQHAIYAPVPAASQPQGMSSGKEKGTIGAYDGNNKHHEILATDGTPKLNVGLLKSKRSIIKEWRFVQPVT